MGATVYWEDCALYDFAMTQVLLAAWHEVLVKVRPARRPRSLSVSSTSPLSPYVSYHQVWPTPLSTSSLLHPT